ncbi:Beta-Ala-His dipeptidase [Neofusicoccum parvum]|uniref:Beta-Ala-His dipeptidase n=1 Tax=Neofusicoccum parvum TaxID=310453 RepID=A0ACB5RT24_9PEZI|nr:Beta-Ala-His dipeptidase [Neofusicoccum parvum]
MALDGSIEMASHPKHFQPPGLFHRMRHDKSILALAASAEYIFAGTEGGEILVYSLETYGRVAIIEGHRGSVLGLCLSQDHQLLLSSAGDRIVNVWNTRTFAREYSIYSAYDIGDVFCVSYSCALRTIYLGAQNTSIQWYNLNEKDKRPAPKPTAHPSFREDRFFDSLGPGGIRTPKPDSSSDEPRDAKGGQVLELDKQYIHQFAHYGYVYCTLLASGSVAGYADKEILISGGGDGVIKLWRLDQEAGGAIHELNALDDGREEGNAVQSMVLDGTFLYGGRPDGEINVWDLETKQLVRSLKTNVGDVLTISIGGGFLFGAGDRGSVQKLNRQYETIGKFRAHDGLVLASAFTIFNNRPVYVTGGNDATIAVWDVRDCQVVPPKSTATSNEQLFEFLKRFVSYRTVSSDPRYKADCRRGASYLRSVFKNFGAATEMLNTEEPFNPVIFAKFRGNPATSGDRKKILFYGHYDVIAAENEDGKWIVDPFSMEGVDGYLYGRGTSDNKGPIMAAIFAVAELLEEQALDSDIIFLIEGEEESGSRGFYEAVHRNKDLVGDIDWVLLANSYWLDDYAPCLTYGLRGVIHATVQIESPHPDLHSGVDGSSLLDESLKDLIMLLAKLTGPHGKIEIPGFYDPIPPLSPEEKQLYEEIGQSLISRNPDLGIAEELANSLIRRWREPSLTIHRFHTSGPENSTIIPRLARASLSFRLVPNQEATEVATALTEYLDSEFAKIESKNKLTVTIDHLAEPWLGDFNNEMYKTLEEAVTEVWKPVEERRRSSVGGSRNLSLATQQQQGSYFDPQHQTTPKSPTTSSTLANGSVTPPAEKTSDDPTVPKKPLKPLYIREGGSIPSIRFLEKEFNAPAAHLPCGQASDSAHLDNERLRLVNLYKSKEIFKKVFRDLPKK